MNVKLSLLALAVAAVFATPAMAQSRDDAETNTYTNISNHIDVDGKVAVRGRIRVNAEGAATIDQDQAAFGNSSSGDGDHTASFGDNALNGASGNIGVNVSAGVGNAQSNDAAITNLSLAKSDDGTGSDDPDDSDDQGLVGPADHDESRDVRRGAMATAMVFSTQASAGNSASSEEEGTFYTATLDGDALGGVAGNVGVNVAAGVGNAQSNGMAASIAEGAVIAKASSDSEQVSMMNSLDSSHGDLDLIATFGGNALLGATGNIGVNVASGVGNVQHNGLAIASSTCNACGQ